jgi:streptolysin S family bacteriocin protoxin
MRIYYSLLRSYITCCVDTHQIVLNALVGVLRTIVKRQCRARVVYHVSAILQSNRTVTNWTGRLKHSTDLIIHSGTLATPPMPVEASDEEVVAACCSCCLPCCASLSLGRIQAQVGADMNQISEGGMLQAYTLVQVSELAHVLGERIYSPHLQPVNPPYTVSAVDLCHTFSQNHMKPCLT